MTGAYYRIQREGKWQSIEIEHLTYAERATIPPEELLKWLDFTCDMIKNFEELIGDSK